VCIFDLISKVCVAAFVRQNKPLTAKKLKPTHILDSVHHVPTAEIAHEPQYGTIWPLPGRNVGGQVNRRQ
jgi:hypothetical protein